MRDLNRRSLLDLAAQSAGVADHLDVRALDISDFEAIPRVVNQVLRDHSRIYVLLNNAGFAYAGFVEDIRLAELRQQMDTNFFGHVAVTQAVLPAMRAQRSGHIIMVSSETGRMGSPGIGSYSASKFASRAGAKPCAWKPVRSASRSYWSNTARSRPTSGTATRASMKCSLPARRPTRSAGTA